VCPSSNAPEQVGGINIGGSVGHVTGDMIDGDKTNVTSSLNRRLMHHNMS
jgi:hypothetical protein